MNFHPSLKRFRFLAAKLAQQQAAVPNDVEADSIRNILCHYLDELKFKQSVPIGDDSSNVNAFEFWNDRHAQYGKLAELSLDIIAAPASQAYVERIFSVYGLLTTGRRNKMKASLAMRVCLRLNKNALRELGCL